MSKVSTEKTEQAYGNAIDQEGKKRIEKVNWWRYARFGMFIHWGLYSELGGVWKGNRIEGLGEWIMLRANIPLEEYKKIALMFNPTLFNAEEWVKTAKEAGMKYLVITAKHHDGFAMYKSKNCDYNIADATPFKRDPIKELAGACKKYDIKLCLYYSHVIDFYHPHGEVNDFAHPNRGERNFQKYLDERCIPQLKELLTQYGPLGCIWFDMPAGINKEQAIYIKSVVEELQPDCIIAGRLGYGIEDIVSMGDNEVPQKTYAFDWETAGTINNTWGYKSYDDNWKDSSSLLRLLIDVCSKGGNYLLNVGPTPEGTINNESVTRLRDIGKWLEINGESIYGSQGYPTPYKIEWGAVTCKNNKLFIHIFDWKQKLALYGLKNKVIEAYILSNGNRVSFLQKKEGDLNIDTLTLYLPEEAQDNNIPVIVLIFEGSLEVTKELLQSPEGNIVLQPVNAEIHRAQENSQLIIGSLELVNNWFNTGDWLNWEFTVLEPGDYEVSMVTMTEKYERGWEGGHEFRILTNGQTLEFTVENHDSYYERDLYYYKKVIARCGKIRYNTCGKYKLELKPVKLIFNMDLGAKLSEIIIKPILQN